jgi:outer membrane protein TolC
MAAVFLSGCLSTRRLDDRVRRLALETAAEQEGLRAHEALDAADEREIWAAEQPRDIVLTRESSLALASRHSRTLQARREALYLAGLDRLGTRRDFGVQLEGTVGWIREVSGADRGEESSELTLSATRILPTGGDLSLTGDARRDDGGEGTGWSSAAGVRIDQPLLAGAGYEASHDALIQSERDYVYALRDFALRRQDHAIDALNAYYDLLTRRSILENTRQNVKQSVFLRERSEALFKIRRAAAIDVLRARQQELSALNQLNVAQSEYEIQKKRFLVQLGLPVDLRVDVAGEIPEQREEPINEAQGLRAGLERRLDVATARDRLRDAQRARRIAENAVLPDLRVGAGVRFAGEEVDSFSDQELEDRASVDVTLTLPLDRRDERDALRRAELGARQAQRDLEEKEDAVRIEILENFSRLQRLAGTLEIERRNREIAEKRVRNAEFRFRNGELSNRDVVEAENELLNARNALSRALVDYEIQRIRLLRNIGLLDVAPDGSLMEMTGTVEWREGVDG